MSATNDHGWADVGFLGTPGDAASVHIEVAPTVPAHRRCACPVPWPGCQRAATQEDWRCDECRETCR